MSNPDNHILDWLVVYNILGEALANINKDIISQCSMQDEDHVISCIILGDYILR